MWKEPVYTGGNDTLYIINSTGGAYIANENHQLFSYFICSERFDLSIFKFFNAFLYNIQCFIIKDS